MKNLKNRLINGETLLGCRLNFGSSVTAEIVGFAALDSIDVLFIGPSDLSMGLAIAVGSKLVPWMNDSGFWIVTEMSNFTTDETLKTFSVMLSIMGITGFIVIYIAASLFPLV